MELLRRDGLTVEVLTRLSYESNLGISLKKNLHYFDSSDLFRELVAVNEWYDQCEILHTLALDYRVKSVQSAILKYHRYYPDRQARKTFDDLLGFRSFVDSYEEIFDSQMGSEFRVADMSKGKANDDGYRGVHLYFQIDNRHYPIEIQYNTYYDRQLNNWLHKYVYKKGYNPTIGCRLRGAYEKAEIITESDFKEVLKKCAI